MVNDTLTAADRLIHSGNYDQALELLEPHKTEPPVALSLADVYLTLGRFTDAEHLLKAALESSLPEHKADLLRQLAQALEGRGHNRKAAEARTLSEQAEALIPDPNTRAAAGLLRLSQSKDPAAALVAAEATLKTNPTPLVSLMAQQVAMVSAYNIERYDEAFSWATKAFGNSQADASVRVHCLQLKGLIAGMQGNYSDALKRFEEATYLVRAGASWATAKELTLVLCSLLSLQGRSTDAIALAQELVDRFPQAKAPGLIAIAQAELTRGNLDAAADALEQGLAATKHRELGLIASARLAAAREQHEEALSLYQTLIKKAFATGVQRSFRRSSVLCLWHVGQQDKAEAERTLLASEHSESRSREEQAGHWRLEARLAFLKQDWHASIAAWKQVLRLEPHPVNYAEAWVGLGDAYGKLGEQEAARFAWQKAGSLTVESIWVRRANDRREMG